MPGRGVDAPYHLVASADDYFMPEIMLGMGVQGGRKQKPGSQESHSLAGWDEAGWSG